MSRNIFHRILYNGKSLGLLLNKKRCGLFRIAIFIIFFHFGNFISSINLGYKRQSRIVKFKNRFHLPLLPPFAIFVEYRMRFGIANPEIQFPFVSALTFRYICPQK